MIVVTFIEVVMVACGYRVKYARAWRVKQRALKLIYGDWAKAYECLSVMLHAMKAKNTGMNFEYVQNLTFWGLRVDNISSMHSGHLDNVLKPSSIVVMYCLLMARF
jgi:hypothetical protein